MNKRLMVVEDNPDLLDIYQVCLQKDGFDVVCARDGEEALKQFVDCKPQVVVCDIKMPKLTGFDVIETIASHPKLNQDVAFIVMSAYGDKDMVDRAEKLGIGRDRYLVKSQATLKDVLRTVRSAFAA
ncbi:response regulator [Candidatus Saccharibacteria bacterium]|nr:response regulator [Candidatus Saccharibacteria bacterium]